jgi:hypothetical protein
MTAEQLVEEFEDGFGDGEDDEDFDEFVEEMATDEEQDEETSPWRRPGVWHTLAADRPEWESFEDEFCGSSWKGRRKKS